MIKIWVLLVFLNNGHFASSGVPTLTFSTQTACQAAITAFTAAADVKTLGRFSGTCVEITKD